MTGTTNGASLSAGFADPVHDAQACFRAVLDAVSRPGRVVEVSGVVPPAPLCVSAAAVVLTLLDADTPVFLDPGAGAARDWVAFHCGAPAVAAAEAAFFMGLSCPELGELPAGSDDDPEDGATAIVQVASLEEGVGLRLTGPGVDGSVVLRVAGLPEDFASRWAANRALFPRGVDLVLCAGARLAALPRSVSVEVV